MYNNPFITNYNPQMTKDRIDNQIAQLQQMKEQIPQNPMQMQQPSINQTFQLTPNTTNTMKYVEKIEDVNKEFVVSDTPFFSKDMSILWIKNTKGEVKTYELNEIIQKDDKDLLIESLQMQIKEMKGMFENAKSNDVDVSEPVESKKSTNVSTNRTIKTK